MNVTKEQLLDARYSAALDALSDDEVRALLSIDHSDPLSAVALGMVVAGVALLAITASIRLWARWDIHNKA